ncbi:MAG TPA: insulinase family protein, partial [Polyangia bacterium]|nr:insulinase family protein [Polyangia bacterium]
LSLAALDGARGAIVTHRPGASQAEIELRCLLPPADLTRSISYDVLSSVVGGWLTDDLRHRYGSTYGVHTSATTLRGGTSYLRIQANVDNGRLPLALGQLRGFWRRFVVEGVSADSVRRGRDSVMVGRLRAYETSPAVVNALVWRWNAGWPLESIDQIPDEIASVEPAQIDATLRACAGNLVLGITGDEGVIRAALAAPESSPTP